MPRFLVFAYACEPDKGSEPGAGWIWSRMIARIGETWVITRENNRPSIEEHLPSTPERDNLRFVYVDLPGWARFWKRRNKGARLYYLLWQAAALSRARKLNRETSFDAAWHLTWANAWIGSLAAMLPQPFIYGPVAGGVSMPWRLSPALGIRGTLYEVARAIARTGARYGNPLARTSWRRAQLILVQNPETKQWLPGKHRRKAVVLPNVVLDRPPRERDRPAPALPFTALYAGRLAPLKGLPLAVRAVALLPDWRLVLCGDGPDERRLRRLAGKLGVEERIEFRDWVPREQVYAWMRRADVFLLPSLHEEGGFVVAEALAEGLPVVSLDRGGPPVIGGAGVAPTTMSGTVRGLAAAMSKAPGSRIGSFPNLASRTEELRALLDASFPSWRLSTTADETVIFEQPGGAR